MTLTRIGDLVEFIPGINPTRLTKQNPNVDINFYDQRAFEIDFNQEYSSSVGKIDSEKNNTILNIGDIVISNSLQLATLVTEANIGKVLTLNFTSVNLKSDKLDKKYFIYLYNEYSDLRKQKERESQGSGVMRISIKSLSEMTIPLIPLEEQKKIATVYFQMLKLKSKLNKYTELVGKITTAIIEKALERK